MVQSSLVAGYVMQMSYDVMQNLIKGIRIKIHRIRMHENKISNFSMNMNFYGHSRFKMS